MDYDPLAVGGLPGDKFKTTGSKNGLRPWEVNAPKDVVHLGHGQELWALTLWGPHDGDFMFHCHNLVHEDNDMMVAAGVGRKSAINGNIYFASDGERMKGEDLRLHTSDQTDEYYETEGDQIKRDDWVFNATDAGEVEGNDGSPYSPQFVANGKINRDARNGMGDRARLIAGDWTWNSTGKALNSTYVCAEICKGYYGVFYPDPQKSGDQLNYRTGYDSTSDNPIHKNIWAVPYPKFSSAASDYTDEFMTVASPYIEHNCTCPDGRI